MSDMRYWHRWAHNLKNVAPQKQNAICKTKAQYSKRNCAFELFKAHCAATINAKNASFRQICISDLGQMYSRYFDPAFEIDDSKRAI